MKYIFTLTTFALLFSFHVNAERVLRGKDAAKAIPGAETVRYRDFSSVPTFVRFSERKGIPVAKWESWMKNSFFKDKPVGFILLRMEQDRIGFEHYRYQQTYKGLPIAYAHFVVHVKNGQVYSMNGHLFDQYPSVAGASLDEITALGKALDFVGAEIYKWEVASEENLLKHELGDPMATYYPDGSIELVNADATLKRTDLRTAWKFKIYAQKPLSHQEVFVDASTGNILFSHNKIHHADTNNTAVTGYSGTQNIVADYTGAHFRLRESSRGNGIRTYDLNNSTNHGSAVDFTHPDNHWNDATVNKFGTDAHWGAEMTYDYFWDKFGRNSIDNNGFMLRSYVHYDFNYSNAFWDGYRMTYGDGSNGNSPFTTLDISGHEITHGLTEYTANLVYEYESGALNESFSDIFGICIEFYANPSAADWLCGEDIGYIIRNLANPNAEGDPDTYGGTYWYTGNADNGGVHTNSGVQNQWFYRLVTGGSGTNDLGNSYSVTGIGMDNAAAIAYRNLTVYLTPYSDYLDARFFSLEAAIDLFGLCSQELESTGDAWYAVGLGAPYEPTVTADFDVSAPSSCSTPHTVQFSNYSSNGTSYLWNFGDGNTSTQVNPTHTYFNYGTYDVTLQVTSSCGSDSKAVTDLIAVDQELPCEYTMQASGNNSITGCSGVLYDNGGPNADYSSNTDSYITIYSSTGAPLIITFSEFDFELHATCGYDKLEIFDGPSSSSPLIGTYCNGSPPPAVIFSTGSSVTVRQKSDPFMEGDGFTLNWECQVPVSPPQPDFSASTLTTCDGNVSFTDLTVNGGNQWFWDFGDGNSSNQQNPTHTYLSDGVYTVKLIATNVVGSDSVLKTNYITVERPSSPDVSDVSVCKDETAEFLINGNGNFLWYNSPSETTPFAYGNSLTTAPLTTTVSYYVENKLENALYQEGPANTFFGLTSYLGSAEALYFDAMEEVEIISVDVTANISGHRTIVLKDAAQNVLDQKTVFLTASNQTVDLNFMVPAGTGYTLATSDTSMSNLLAVSSNVSFPYNNSGVVSITGATGWPGTYPFFFNWQVRDFCVSDRIQVTAIVDCAAGISEYATHAEMILFPNPAEDYVTARLGEAGLWDITLSSAEGRIVAKQKVNGQSATFQVEDLPRGVYYVNAISDRSFVVKKLVVQ